MTALPWVLGCSRGLFEAYALSSNYNFDVGLGCGYDSIQAALAGIKANESAYSELEMDLIMALTFRSSEAARAAVDPAKLNLGEQIAFL